MSQDQAASNSDHPVKKPLPPAFVANQWKPGQSGNPAGKAKGSKTLTKLLREALYRGDSVKARQMIESAIDQAIEGNPKFFENIMARVDGPIPVKVEIEKARVELVTVVEHILTRHELFDVLAEVLSALDRIDEEGLEAVMAQLPSATAKR